MGNPLLQTMCVLLSWVLRVAGGGEGQRLPGSIGRPEGGKATQSSAFFLGFPLEEKEAVVSLSSH